MLQLTHPFTQWYVILEKKFALSLGANLCIEQSNSLFIKTKQIFSNILVVYGSKNVGWVEKPEQQQTE